MKSYRLKMSNWDKLNKNKLSKTIATAHKGYWFEEAIGIV
jgi:hypothetical protein